MTGSMESSPPKRPRGDEEGDARRSVRGGPYGLPIVQMPKGVPALRWIRLKKSFSS